MPASQHCVEGNVSKGLAHAEPGAGGGSQPCREGALLKVCDRESWCTSCIAE
ncbi:hypothetical protein TRAPUB_8870 [Trametes pubescens]|uniref:Uncharacterized protein n=1 Tax=Trametes pubescens TaxID=154538 RepID=A0A1M2W440_TRAPU|nr:hypothetical protein TRAPUB_8870 [Trametes pubescens]